MSVGSEKNLCQNELVGATVSYVAFLSPHACLCPFLSSSGPVCVQCLTQEADNEENV